MLNECRESLNYHQWLYGITHSAADIQQKSLPGGRLFCHNHLLTMINEAIIEC